MIDPAGYDELPDGTVVAESRPDGDRVVVFNRAAERLTGIAATEAVGRPLAGALPLVDAAGRDWWQCTRPFDGLPTRTRQVERALQLPDGRTVLVAGTYVRERPGGPTTRVVLTLRGREARDRAEREHADLIATAAHEIRSPLAGVKGFTATLLAKWDRFSDEQRQVMLRTIDADADRLTRLIVELLDVARIDSGRLQLRRVPIDLGALVDRRVEARVAAGVDADRIVVDRAEGLPEVWVDPDKIGQVVDNLLDNALHHGSGTVTVTVSHDPDGVVVTVADQGPGVPAHQASRIFGRFWRGPERGGSGLGLYVVHGLVAAHGGRVALVPPSEGGARFVVVLPLGAPDVELGAV